MSWNFTQQLQRFGPGTIHSMDLNAARSYCAWVTRTHYENFTVASALLPRKLLPHFYPIYAYCRWADDLGDETEGGEVSIQLLRWWRESLLDVYRDRATHPVMFALKPTIERFQIPPDPFLNLLIAFEQDQFKKEYETFDEILNYCRYSANPVGHLVLYLGECFDAETAKLSDFICTGLQLANFWQDVCRDWDNLKRIYIPKEDRIRFQYNDEDFQAKRFTTQFQQLMQFQVDRTRDLFERGRPLLELIPRQLRIDIDLFLRGGLEVLQAIELQGYDVWSRRPKVEKSAKMKLLGRAILQQCLAPKTRCDSPKITTQVSASYRWCDELTRKAAKNFIYAFQVLPRVKRRAMDALYAYMRVTDDLSDEEAEVDSKKLRLADWRNQLHAMMQGDYHHPVHAALHDTIRKYQIPIEYLEEVITGVESDLEFQPMQHFDDLYRYCYRVASVVGLACIHIWGFNQPEAKIYAESAGIAFQLTNILRDLHEDRERGRIYLPQTDFAKFGFTPDAADWKSNPVAFREFMQFQVNRAKSFYCEGEKLFPFLDSSGRAVFRVMFTIYFGLLQEIESRDYDVFRERISLTKSKKLRSLLQVFPAKWGWKW